MKIYVIHEIAWEYNDEHYYQPEQVSCSGEPGSPVKAYRRRANAEAECERLNAARRAKNAADANPMQDGDDKPIDRFYAVVEVEAAEHEVQDYTSAKQAVEAAREAAKQAATLAFKAGCEQLFGEHADLQSFAWNQYTPYFNDGDPCEFSANTSDPDINGEETYSHPLQKPVTMFLREFTDEDMLAMFGDHVRVTVERGGEPQVDDYEHG